jgi:hypothetical protein
MAVSSGAFLRISRPKFCVHFPYSGGPVVPRVEMTPNYARILKFHSDRLCDLGGTCRRTFRSRETERCGQYFIIIWTSTAAARVRFQVRSCGISAGQSGTGVGFLQKKHTFPLPILIPPSPPYSVITRRYTVRHRRSISNFIIEHHLRVLCAGLHYGLEAQHT